MKNNLILCTDGNKLTAKIVDNLQFCVLKVKHPVSIKCMSCPKFFWDVASKHTAQSKELTAKILNLPDL